MQYTDQIQLIRKLKQQPRHGNAFDTFINELKNLGNDAKLAKFGTILGALADGVTNVANVTTHYEQVNESLRKGFGLNIKQSVEFGTQLDKISKNLDINSAKLKNYAVALGEIITKNKAFYTSGNTLSTALLKQREAFQKLGISTEAQNKFLKISAIMNKDAGKGMQSFAAQTAAVAKQIESVTGESGVYEDVIEELANVGADVAGTFSKMPGGLAKAVYQAKKLGTTLNEVVAIGDKMLDIEQSTASEIEYQIFTGRQLTDSKGDNWAEQMRIAAATQDTARQQELLKDLVEKEGDTILTNKQGREALAAMTGIQADKLIEMVQTSKANNATNANLNKIYTEQLNLNSELDNIQQDNYINSKNQLSTVEQIADETTKQMTSLREGNASPADAAEQAAARTEKLVDLTSQLGQVTKDAYTGMSSTLDLALGAAIGYNTITGITTKAKESLQSGTEEYEKINAPGNTGTTPTTKKDFFASAAAGTTISGNFGSFLLDSRDDILAAPGIDEIVGGSRNTAQATSGASSADITKLAAAVVNAIKSLSINVENKFDGEKIATYLEIRQQDRLNRG